MILTEEERKEIAKRRIIAPNCKLLTEEEIEKWGISKDRVKEKYLNTVTQQVLPYELLIKMNEVEIGWDENPKEEVNRMIQQGIYVLVEDEKAVVK